MSEAHDYERLGAFYLGRRMSPEGALSAEPLLYDAKDLTTHAVCVGMTGSGKTGLCIALLEEAAIDGIPAIAIDPKGDLGNLLLAFPSLAPGDFEPWIDEGEAAREGHTPKEHARAVAERWRTGLAEWGQDGARIQRFRDATDACIYTPGSAAGRPLRVLRSFDAPPAALAGDADALRDRIQATVSGLLALLGMETDPIRSREHILVSNVIEAAWAAGRGLDLPTLIREIQKPPFERVGVFDLETFFPTAERLSLAMTLNNLLASPGFAAWMEGESLDVGRLLYTPEGRPRLSVLSIAHLSEAERMFFVTLLLNEVVAWMRAQPGTQSLRAILYMDEVFGYFPPVSEPPSKKPMLTLLKQARAYGLGVVLATQNPVDLDYKGLANTGTWLLGRLQTERDKARVLEGLEGASATTGATFDRARMERILAGLGKRVFLMNNVHEDEPQLFQSRWALSYLRGPLTREQIRDANRARGHGGAAAEPRGDAGAAPAPPAPAAVPAQAAAAPAPAPPPEVRPVVPAGIVERFALATEPAPASASLVYRPFLYAVAHLHYVQAKADLDEWQKVGFRASLEEAPRGSPWTQATEVDPAILVVREEPEPGARFAPLASGLGGAKGFERFGKMLASHVYRGRPLRLWRCSALGTISRPSESEGEFRVRLRQLRHEQRDLALEKLRQRYAPKLARLEERIRAAEARVDEEREQYESSKMQAAISVGATMLGALFGRKIGSARNVGRATTAVRGAQRAARERGDISRAEEKVEGLREELAALEQESQADLDRIRSEADEAELELEERPIRPRKSDVSVEQLSVLWLPWWVRPDGIAAPAFRTD